jgi:hypothetical protein
MLLRILLVRDRKFYMGKFDRRMRRSAACAVCILICRLCVGQQIPPEQSSPAQPPPALTESTQSSPAQATPVAPSQAQTSPAPLPDAPNAAPATNAAAVPAYEQQPKRIMGVLPNFRSVTAGANVPKETTREKLVTATEDNYDYTSLFFAVFIAADSFATKSTPEFHQGAAGFARYYWHTVADQSVENYFVELIVPAVTHEDSRYYAMGREGGSFWKRAGYSLTRGLITRTDTDKPTFNYSEVVGSAAAASISIFYYPTKEQTVANGLRDWGLDVTYDSITFVFHEFWPDIHHAIFRTKDTKAAANP